MTRRFAEDTTVTVNKSQGAVKELLKRAGADKIAVYEASDNSAVAFQIGTSMYRLTVPTPKGARNPAQEERRIWRLLLLLIKSKLEAVREGATTIEREFLADMVIHDGRTVGEWAKAELKEAQRLGRMPTSLMIEGPK